MIEMVHSYLWGNKFNFSFTRACHEVIIRHVILKMCISFLLGSIRKRNITL